MFTFSLNTFVKICLLDTGGRIAEIRKKLDSTGGYDFYKTFQKATRGKFSGSSQSDVEETLISPTKDSERLHNRNAYDAVQGKFGKIVNVDAVSARNRIEFKVEGIEITLDPLFTFEKSGEAKTYSVWSTKKPALSQKFGALACFIMRDAYKSTALANSQFYYFDTTTNKTYSEKQITSNTQLIFEADLRSISNLLKEL